MIVALWIIAVCEVIRAVQNMMQLAMVRKDTGARDNAYEEFVKSLKQTDREFVKQMLEEFEREDGTQGDLISRQDAIETVGDWMIREFGYLDPNRQERLIDALEARPSADWPRGEWLDTEFEKIKRCSRCCTEWGIYSIEEFDFCPSCGADMRSE